MIKYFLQFLLAFYGHVTAVQHSAIDTSRTPLPITYKGFPGDTASALNGLRTELKEILPDTKYRRMTPSMKIVFFEPDNTLHSIYAVNPSLPVLPASV